MRRSLFSLLLGLLLTLSGACASAATAEPVGRIMLASGEVQIVGRDKVARAAARGDTVSEGDTVVTGSAGSAHIRMADDGIIAMRSNTTIAIETFRWSGKEDGTERSVLSLVKGGFRAITGVIGRTNKSQYIVNTTTATIGIRGTDHEPFFVAPPGPGEPAAGEPGTYNKVNVGETFIRSPGGTIELGANEVGFASVLPDAPPVKLERMPEFMRATALPRGKPDMRGVRDTPGRDLRRAELVRAFQERTTIAQLLRQLIARRTATAGEEFDLGAMAGSFSLAPQGTSLTASIVFRDGGTLRGNTGGLVTDPAFTGDSIILDPNNNPLIVSDKSGFRYARQDAPLVDFGRALIDETGVKWGVYAGGLRFDETNGVSQTLLFTFMMASNATPPALLANPGVALYNNTVGFTRPVDENRRIGGTATLSAGVIFGANPRIVSYNLNVNDASARTWSATLNATQSLQSFSRAQASANLSVSCTGACASTGQGTASGFVIGPNRGGMISSYGLIAGPASVTGSVAVSR